MAGTLKLNAVQLGDSATATQNFVWQTNVDGTAKLARGNVGATTQDILTVDASGNVLVKSPAGLGYGTGAGGTVTQATSKTTAVTLNTPTGQITMNNAVLGAATSVTFILNNSLIGTADNFIVTCNFGGGNYWARVQNTGNGVAAIVVTNSSGGSLSDAVTLNFAIIKGATT